MAGRHLAVWLLTCASVAAAAGAGRALGGRWYSAETIAGWSLAAVNGLAAGWLNRRAGEASQAALAALARNLVRTLILLIVIICVRQFDLLQFEPFAGAALAAYLLLTAAEVLHLYLHSRTGR